MFESIMALFKNMKKSEKNTNNSKDAAKERLHLVLMQDRANVSADFLDLMRQEIIDVIKKYIEVDENEIDVRLTNKQNEDGTTDMVDINTLHFDEMEEILRDELESYSLTVYYFDGITEEEISEMFFRLNNGKPLSAIELSRAKAKSMEAIKELGQHKLFKSALTEKAMEKYTNEDIVIKSYAMLHETEPCMETKSIRPLIANAEFTEADKSQLREIYDRIISMHGMIEDKKIAKRLLTRTHLISIVPIVWKSIQKGLSDKQMAEWAAVFFSGSKSATLSEIYNRNAGSGSGKKESVRRRLEEIESFFNKSFGIKQNL